MAVFGSTCPVLFAAFFWRFLFFMYLCPTIYLCPCLCPHPTYRWCW
jgi:hypothetical protein